MATSLNATKVFLPISAVKKVESNVAPTHHYNTRLAAQKRQQQLGSHGQPSQEIEYKQVAQTQDPNRAGMQHGIVHSGPSVDRSQKPVKSDKPILPSGHANLVPGRPVHNYEPIPRVTKESMSYPDKERSSQPVKQPLSDSHQPKLEQSNSVIKDQNPYNLENGSMIEFSNPPQYGVIKWIGYLLNMSKKCKVAGVEMVSPSGMIYMYI